MHRIHTIPVPEGWSIEQAWEAIHRGDRLPEDYGDTNTWANVETDEHDKFIRIVRPEENESTKEEV